MLINKSQKMFGSNEIISNLAPVINGQESNQ